ncbi:TerD family protein [Prosthecobacter sp.]|uniref:TerD family protein n=1 Tax=Prosthecobacter sp. TaxID=1965333 RepID=UPI00378517B0
MAINLTKGQTIDLRKDANDLEQITIGLGWKVREKKQGLFAGLFGKKDEVEFDLDAIAFLMNDNNQVINRGDSKLVGGDVVFFNSRRHPTGTVIHSGDNRIGGTGANDDEQIVVRLNSIPAQYKRILFLVCIYQGIKLGQHFGQVESAYIRAVDGKGKEMARFSLSSEAAYDGKCTMVFGEVYRRNDGWKFRAIGDAHPYDSFVHLLKEHLPN